MTIERSGTFIFKVMQVVDEAFYANSLLKTFILRSVWVWVVRTKAALTFYFNNAANDSAAAAHGCIRYGKMLAEKIQVYFIKK